ncbi:MAG: hypothetical protein QOF31_3022 [Mycobacterium sp.]|nr:hypothetical protein [Mycobacterium sp.]
MDRFPSSGPISGWIVGLRGHGARVRPWPAASTVPQPVQFTWDGSSWTQVSDFQWDCMMPDTTIQWSPARADVRYTPQPDGTLSGTMHTDIMSGPCQGTLDIYMTAERA